MNLIFVFLNGALINFPPQESILTTKALYLEINYDWWYIIITRKCTWCIFNTNSPLSSTKQIFVCSTARVCE